MLKQNLSQKMLQKLSPQQIQLMKLLQIPTATLDQRIQEELESNPALDEGEDNTDVFDLGDENSDDRAEEKWRLQAVNLNYRRCITNLAITTETGLLTISQVVRP